MKTLFLIAVLALVSAQTARAPIPADAARSPKGTAAMTTPGAKWLRIGSGRQAVVPVEQVADTRAGIRIDPKMALFAMQHAAGSRESADLETVDDYMSRMSDRRPAQEGAK